MQLTYETTNTKTGRVFGVYNERVSGRTVSQYVGPFVNIGEARSYGDEYVEGWGMVYSPRSEAVEIDGKWYARCSRATSCD
jgi:hypothetical protein